MDCYRVINENIMYMLPHPSWALPALLLIQTVSCSFGQCRLQRVIFKIQPLQTLQTQTVTKKNNNTETNYLLHYILQWASFISQLVKKCGDVFLGQTKNSPVITKVSETLIPPPPQYSRGYAVKLNYQVHSQYIWFRCGSAHKTP